MRPFLIQQEASSGSHSGLALLLVAEHLGKTRFAPQSLWDPSWLLWELLGRSS